MAGRASVATLLLSALLVALPSAAYGRAAGGVDVGAGRQIEMRAEHGWFVVPVVVDGADTLRFILDTAAALSAVTETLAARLGLPEGRVVTAQGASGAARLRVTTLPRLVFGPVEAERVRVLVLRDSTLTPEAGGEGEVAPYDGVLGVDILSRFDLLIDPVAGVLRLFQHGERPSEQLLAVLGAPMPLRRIAGSFVGHDVEVNGVVLPAILDTGARHVVLNGAAAAAAGVQSAQVAVPAMGVGGEQFDVSEGRVEELRLGATIIAGLRVRVADLPVFGTLGLGGGAVVLLGNPAVDACPFFLSYRTSTVRYCRARTTFHIPDLDGVALESDWNTRSMARGTDSPPPKRAIRMREVAARRATMAVGDVNVESGTSSAELGTRDHGCRGRECGIWNVVR